MIIISFQNAEKKDSPTKRTSPASSDMEFDSEEEGQLSPRGRDDYHSDRASPPRERERTRDRRKEDRPKTDTTSKAAVPDRKTTREDLTRIQLTRMQLMKECTKPWFEDYVKRTWEQLIGTAFEADGLS
jgi:Plus-3 domain